MKRSFSGWPDHRFLGKELLFRNERYERSWRVSAHHAIPFNRKTHGILLDPAAPLGLSYSYEERSAWRRFWQRERAIAGKLRVWHSPELKQAILRGKVRPQ